MLEKYLCKLFVLLPVLILEHDVSQWQLLLKLDISPVIFHVETLVQRLQRGTFHCPNLIPQS